MTIKAIKKKIMPVLIDKDVERAAVFGSFSRGENRKKSDIDIVIEYKQDNKSLLDFVGLKLALEGKLKKKVDLVEYCALHPLLRQDIVKEQIVIL